MAMKMGKVLTGLALGAAIVIGSGKAANAQGVFRLNKSGAIPTAPQGKGVSKIFDLNKLEIVMNSNTENIETMRIEGTNAVADGRFELFRAEMGTDRNRAIRPLTNNAAVYFDQFTPAGNGLYHVKMHLAPSGYSKDQNILQAIPNNKYATQNGTPEIIHDVTFSGVVAVNIYDKAKGNNQSIQGNINTLSSSAAVYGILLGRFIGDQSNVVEEQRLPPVGQGQKMVSRITNYGQNP